MLPLYILLLGKRMESPDYRQQKTSLRHLPTGARHMTSTTQWASLYSPAPSLSHRSLQGYMSFSGYRNTVVFIYFCCLHKYVHYTRTVTSDLHQIMFHNYCIVDLKAHLWGCQLVFPRSHLRWGTNV